MIWIYPIRVKFVIVNVTCKYGGNSVIATKCGVPNISIDALFENGEFRLKLSLLVIISHNSNSEKGNTSSR